VLLNHFEQILNLAHVTVWYHPLIADPECPGGPFGELGLMVSNGEPLLPPPRQTSREFVGDVVIFHPLPQLEPDTTNFIHGTLVGYGLRWKR
jgi:hypothetical protein